MRLLVTGGDGQVGRALARRGDAGVTVLAPDLPELDLCDASRLARGLADAAPAAVINCAAYTAVDAAEQHRDRAYAVNAEGAGTLARLCAERRVPLIHVSTDYVFDGTARRPYREDDPLAPLGVYGASKAAGEAAVHAAHGGAVVVRTSWVFSRDRPCFVRTIARAALERPALRVVDDQLGCPTYADDLAAVLLALARRAVAGEPLARTYHACNQGETSWCGFARAIVAEVRKHRRTVACTDVAAIPTAEYPTPAKRPAYSVLDTSRLRGLGITLPPWTFGLAEAVPAVLAELAP